MDHQLDRKLQEEIAATAFRHGVKKVILFGSRARGDHHQRSDIDLAVLGGDTAGFALDAEEEIQTLLRFDIVDLGKPVQPELLAEIERDGVVFYEKI